MIVNTTKHSKLIHDTYIDEFGFKILDANRGYGDVLHHVLVDDECWVTFKNHWGIDWDAWIGMNRAVTWSTTSFPSTIFKLLNRVLLHIFLPLAIEIYYTY